MQKAWSKVLNFKDNFKVVKIPYFSKRKKRISDHYIYKKVTCVPRLFARPCFESVMEARVRSKVEPIS